MTSGGNNFNDFPEKQLTKFQLGGKNITILHTFAAPFQYHFCPWPKNGTFGVPGRPRPGRGTMRPKYSTYDCQPSRTYLAIRRRCCSACTHLPNSRILASMDDQLTTGAAPTAGPKCRRRRRRRRRADPPESAAAARQIWRRRRRGVTGLGL